MATPTNWVVLTAAQAKQYMADAVVTAADENGRVVGILADQVAKVRGAILNAGRTALSLTAGSVPPEATGYVKVLCVHAIISAVPQLAKYAESESFRDLTKDANAWLEAVEKGQSVTPPNDPDPDTVPLGNSWGDLQGTAEEGKAGKIDLTTD